MLSDMSTTSETETDTNTVSELTTRAIVEAVLFATDAPLAGGKLAQIVGVGDARDMKKQIAELNELAGQTFAKSILEWNLPPWRFRNAGTPGAYLTWARTALFGSVIVKDFDNEAFRDTTLNVGAQIDFELIERNKTAVLE